MKRKNMFVSLAVVLLMLVASFGCDLLSTEPSDSGDSATSYALTPYREVRVSDFEPLGESYELDEDIVVIPEVGVETSMYMIDNMAAQWGWLINHTGTHLDEGFDYLPTRSIEALLYLSIQDEAFAFVNDDVTATEFAIEHFDILMSGGLNSLSSLIGLMTGASEFPVTALEADGTIGLSAFLTGTEYDVDSIEPEFQREVMTSLFLDIGIEYEQPLDGEGTPSTVISGEANFSFGFNYLEYDETYVIRAPMVLQFDILPFEIDLAEFYSFVDENEIDSLDDALWTEFSTIIWGSGHAEDGIVITQLGGNEASATIYNYTENGYEAFGILVGLIEAALSSSDE